MTNNPYLLLIETSTGVCSAALARGEELITRKAVTEEKAHARVIAPMVKELLEDSGMEISQCDAVVVSEGPGSYTGLRVGVSLAKGICYGSGKPLISVSSLELLARLAIDRYIPGNSQINKNRDGVANSPLIVPMIDARRMEVYCAVYDIDGNLLSPVAAHILSSQSFAQELSAGIVLFTGDGAKKFEQIVTSPNAVFMEILSDASGMIKPALEKFEKGQFADVAYFEPFYLKDFVAGVSRKSII
jgi:tRNA threonylcarbamoyladenosine biosynthesis protein TsaB